MRVRMCRSVTRFPATWSDTDAHKKGFDFFKLFRDRTAGGDYSTPESWKAIGNVGNLPMAEFPGPPPEVLKHLGLA